MNSRDIVLQLAQEKAEEVLSVNLSTFTFNDTIVFALEAENEFPEVNRVDSLRALKAEKNGEIYATLLQRGRCYQERSRVFWSELRLLGARRTRRRIGVRSPGGEDHYAIYKGRPEV